MSVQASAEAIEASDPSPVGGMMRPCGVPIEVEPLRRLDLRDRQEDRRGDFSAPGLLPVRVVRKGRFVGSVAGRDPPAT